MLDDEDDKRRARTLAKRIGAVLLVWLVLASVAGADLVGALTGGTYEIGLVRGALLALLGASTIMTVLAMVAGDGLLEEIKWIAVGMALLTLLLWPLIVLML